MNQLKKTILNKTALTSLTLVLSCTSINAQYSECHRLPPLPILPIIKSEELKGLSMTTYRKLVERERRLRAHIRILRAGCL